MDAKIQELESLLAVVKSEVASLQKGKKASGARSRSALLKIKNLAHSLRAEVTITVKSIPVKSKKPVAKVAVVEPAAPPASPALEREVTVKT